MKCAFKVHMPQQQSDDSESEEENLDDEHLWEDMNLVEDTELLWSSGESLSCFAHSLQLLVNDGMKEVRAISRTIAKTSRFTMLLHSSSQFKEKFEAMFDSNKTIPAANTTRWNSTFKQVLSVPAFSAPVERVFSRGGIIMRLHRARLGHKMLQSLIFLKCNQMLL
ncbi:uncharacterized protein LOC115778158 [Tachysurus ichikawai]